jgi:hypothetical protein
MVERAEKPIRLLGGWQRFPSTFVLDGGLVPGRKWFVPARLLPPLLAAYALLYEENVSTDPDLSGNSLPLDLKRLAQLSLMTASEARKALQELQELRLLRVQDSRIEVLDPLTRAWPPDRFAMLPAQYAVSRLKAVAGLARQAGTTVGEVVAVYLVLVAQRNRETGEIWFSRTATPERLGQSLDVVKRNLKVLLAAKLLVRPGPKSWVYKLVGFTKLGLGGVPKPIRSRL